MPATNHLSFQMYFNSFVPSCFPITNYSCFIYKPSHLLVHSEGFPAPSICCLIAFQIQSWIYFALVLMAPAQLSFFPIRVRQCFEIKPFGDAFTDFPDYSSHLCSSDWCDYDSFTSWRWHLFTPYSFAIRVAANLLITPRRTTRWRSWLDY